MAPDRFSYEDLLSRLGDAEEQIHALLSSETDAIVSAAGVHVLRLHETDRALQAARHGLEQMLAQKTQDLRLANEKLRQEIVDRKQAEEALRKSQERLRRALRVPDDGSFQLERGRKHYGRQPQISRNDRVHT